MPVMVREVSKFCGPRKVRGCRKGLHAITPAQERTPLRFWRRAGISRQYGSRRFALVRALALDGRSSSEACCGARDNTATPHKRHNAPQVPRVAQAPPLRSRHAAVGALARGARDNTATLRKLHNAPQVPRVAQAPPLRSSLAGDGTQSGIEMNPFVDLGVP